MVWILITTFMVVVGTGHCSEATAASIDRVGSSECQLLKASPQPPKAQFEQVTQSMQLPSAAIATLELCLDASLVTQSFGSGRALGSSMLAEKRFSGTSPPATLVL